MPQMPQEPDDTIVLVEDDLILRAYISEGLSALGCRVREFSTGEGAIAYLTERPAVDTLLTDIKLGGRVEGWEVAKAYREANPQMPVVYMSNFASRADRLVPMSVFLAKPCEPEAVLRESRKLRQGAS